ncbi:flagellar biosynthetic protein FliO [Chromobacterium vaccinii]|uniref:flagellar biosynthetic protein FliO n=1 Tax=Chromobacterium vaccinii TaxID=1108595 RepID=UPI001E2A3ABF|nr:flagellar biosynthetic protein FliO [Chromobacterium vaccinii]MCD4483208.1 flagellar biosynthetic protein FliO [Chromobacterium vaccinii]MCD4501053.1 flagellar biosynthetic protein FliO [Chromobacterium vaccinii]
MQLLLALSFSVAVLSASAAGMPCAQGTSAPACAVSSSEPAHAPLRFRQEPAAGPAALLGPYEILGGLALIGAAACWWRQRYAKGGLAGRGDEGIRLLAKRRLSAKSSLYVIEHGGREIMLAESERGITVIRDDSKS